MNTNINREENICKYFKFYKGAHDDDDVPTPYGLEDFPASVLWELEYLHRGSTVGYFLDTYNEAVEKGYVPDYIIKASASELDKAIAYTLKFASDGFGSDKAFVAWLETKRT